MNTYSSEDYPNLYEEILKDYNWTWGKFSPVNYPNLSKDSNEKYQQEN